MLISNISFTNMDHPIFNDKYICFFFKFGLKLYSNSQDLD